MLVAYRPVVRVHVTVFMALPHEKPRIVGPWYFVWVRLLLEFFVGNAENRT